MSHVLQHTTTYEKPGPSRRMISDLIGVGMLSAEGQTHKRQRRVATPAFSLQTMRALVPLVFSKGTVLKKKWMSIISEAGVRPGEGFVINVCSWASRATFDVMGSAGFDYEFSAIQNDDNELLRAYIEMFETAVSRQSDGVWFMITLYYPLLGKLFVSNAAWCLAR